MFYYLKGDVTVLEQNLAVIDVGGVGYACFVSLNTMSYLEIGKEAKLYTYCNIKEDAFDIYGFHSINEKRSFELLLSVSGVGPKAALSILSSSTPEGLALAIINGDEKAITIAQGIGKRIAQRVILELKDKISKESAEIVTAGVVPSVPAGASVAKHSEASAALAVLGFTPAEAASILRTIDVDNLSVEEIIREALAKSLK